jgi:hypothetical protein
MRRRGHATAAAAEMQSRTLDMRIASRVITDAEGEMRCACCRVSV